ncbi:MAG: GAP family protein [Coriobacteriia bacterium]|nr:GAP family protein [Coriobacteriia bacterium]
MNATEIARVLPFALGVAASPVPIVGVLVILLGQRGRVGSVVFAAAWVLGNALAIGIAVVFAGHIRQPRAQLDLPYEGAIFLLLGIGLVAGAWLSRRGRKLSEKESRAPDWVKAVDSLSPAGGALVALSNAVTSPKNLALALGCGAAIRSMSPFFATDTTLALVYVVVASITVVVPVVVYFVMGEKAQAALAGWKAYVTARSASVMEVTVFVFGVALAVKGLINLLG